MTGPPREAISLWQSDSCKGTDTVKSLRLLHCRMLPSRWALNRQKLLQPPAFLARTDLQLYWRSPAALRSALNQASALTHLVNGSSLLYGVLRNRGLPHLPLLAVLETIHLPLEGGVSNGCTPKRINQMAKPLILTLLLGSLQLR